MPIWIATIRERYRLLWPATERHMFGMARWWRIARLPDCEFDIRLIMSAFRERRESQFFSLSGLGRIFPFFSLIFDLEGNFMMCFADYWLFVLCRYSWTETNGLRYIRLIFLRINQFVPFLFSFSFFFLIYISSYVYIYVISRVIGKLESNR